MAKKRVSLAASGLAHVDQGGPRLPAIREVNIEGLLQNAVDKGTPVETMERLLAMRTQLKQERARESYNRAMAAFQSECPTIVKTKEVKTRSGQVAYRYAPIESIVAQVKDLLQKHGFSYSTTMELKEAGVRVVCRVTHAEGHSEESPMEVPFGSKTDIMSQSQVAAAATTFAKRYSFCNAFGIMTGDDDTDARAEESQKDRMTSYTVPRVVPDESDEAGGYRHVPVMDETNDGHGLDVVVADKKPADTAVPASTQLKMQIATLLREKRGFVTLGKSAEQYRNEVMDATGIALEPENYLSIIEELKSL